MPTGAPTDHDYTKGNKHYYVRRPAGGDRDGAEFRAAVAEVLDLHFKGSTTDIEVFKWYNGRDGARDRTDEFQCRNVGDRRDLERIRADEVRAAIDDRDQLQDVADEDTAAQSEHSARRTASRMMSRTL
jgi:hypothetical protein